ncbi:ABC transporter substrate-binding protein [uncultured Treponema sp.]|uniref:ABC transporter substrate-binding protein n=1 Tax=uncultured Treponema sp. TaxID=162155 RepID=UPI0025DA9DBC|nr:ABC transporter substrate-binding protein [uncultured Treponema sp.]
MKKTNKILSVLASGVMLMGLVSCGEKKAASVRFLNFKPEVTEQYKQLAAEYEKQTGVKVIVETAANNSYEQTLMSKMATKEAPTLFQINGPKGYARWKDYCADLKNTELYKHLSDKSIAVTADGGVYGIPYAIEGYGIIYNKALTDSYFALPSKETSYSSMDEINTFAKLKEIVADMQKNAEKLGVKGVFASTSLKAGEDWRWQTHLANLPVYYEFKTNNTDLASDATNKIDFSFGDNFRNIFDLYLDYSVVDRKTVGTKTVVDSMSEFALENCIMVQNGNWAWGQIADVQGNKVLPENVKYLPIYTGVDGEEAQGLCVGTENFFSINSAASEADQKAAADFIYWLFSSEIGKNYVTNEFHFIAPFDTFSESERPTDPLAKEVIAWTSKPGINSVPWNFTLFPSQKFKDDFGSSLLRYAQGSKEWTAVASDVVSSWAKESASAQ